MGGREFLDTADRLAQAGREADYRSAVSRAYYAVFIECRDALLQWGFSFAQRNSHRDVQQRFYLPTDKNLNAIGALLGQLAVRRNAADYEMSGSRHTFDRSTAVAATKQARTAIDLLDAIASDPGRRGAAILAIAAAFP